MGARCAYNAQVADDPEKAALRREVASLRHQLSACKAHTAGLPRDDAIATRIDYAQYPLSDEQLVSITARQYDPKPSSSRPELPVPTSNAAQLEADFVRWGYCVVGDAASAEQSQAHRDALRALAAGERARGEADVRCGGALQTVYDLPAQGGVLCDLVALAPSAAQHAPLLDALLTKILGPHFHLATSHGAILRRGAGAQQLHQDQSMVPLPHPPYPLFCNALWCHTDFDALTGGTYVVPGSHRANADQPLPLLAEDNVVVLTAPAGSCVLLDSRTLHALGERLVSGARLVTRALYAKGIMRAFGWAPSPDTVNDSSTPTLRRLLGVDGYFPYPAGGRKKNNDSGD